jgi:hypothetical protein
MTTQQPEALRLADIVERLNVGVHSQAIAEEYSAAARELRRLNAENEALKQQIAATQPAAQGMEARDAAFEAVRKAFCKVQRYSFLLDSRGNVRRCADHCGNWVEFEAVHTLFEPQSVDAAIAAQA